MKLSVVIPVYNSAACIDALFARLDAALRTLDMEWEVILVDDDSKDGVWSRMVELCGQYPGFRGVRLLRNQGQAIATLCGIELARGDIVVTMDDDLQHRPEDIGRLIRPLLDGEADCVMASFPAKRHAGYRNLASRAVGWLNRRAYELPDHVRLSPFRAMNRHVARRMLSFRMSRPALAQLIFLSTDRIVNVDVAHDERHAGRSNYTLRRSFSLALDHFLNANNVPLRAISVLGLGACALAFLLGLYVLIRALLGQTGVPGWASVMVVMSVLMGINLLGIGVLSEYLSRVLREMRTGSLYAIREDTGRDD